MKRALRALPGRASPVALLLAVLTAVFWPAALRGEEEPVHVPIPGGLRGKLCYECHIRGVGIVLPSEERPAKYSIASAWLSYLDSPHGRLRMMGDTTAPMCEDCHLTREWKDILPQQDPNSPIHPANLPRICARCHGEGMLTANTAAGSMHLELRKRSPLPGEALETRYGFLPGITKLEKTYYLGPFDVVAVVYFFFLALTVGTLTTISGYMVLDLYRKLYDRWQERRRESDHEE